MIHRVFLASLLAAGATTAAAQISKCTDAAGKVSYQDTPCEVGKKTAAQIRLDKVIIDEFSIRRAQDERERLERMSRARQENEAAEAEHEAKIMEAQQKAQAREESEARADARAAAIASRPIYAPAAPAIVIQERNIHIHRAAPAAPAPAPKPAQPACTGSPCK